MEQNQPEGPLCQSCGMPIRKAEDYGTDTNGLKVNDYCRYCFQKGQFTEPSITMQQMIDRVARVMVDKMKMPESEAKGMAEKLIPKLKRWQQ